MTAWGSSGRCTWWDGTARFAMRSGEPRRRPRSSLPWTRTPVAEFTGKVALVTGVGRVGQIGHAVARALGAAGARLVLADRSGDVLGDRVREFAGEGITALASAGDLTTPDAARAAVALAQRQFGGLDAVINVAGGLTSFGDFLQLTPETVDRELAINLKTTLFVCQAAIPAL